MTKRRFFIIMVDVQKAGSWRKFHRVLDKAIDWIEFTPGAWLLWTSSDARRWYTRFKRHLSPEDRVFIIEVNPSDRAGTMPREFWKFIDEKASVES